MRILRTVGILAAIAAACVVFLAITTRQFDYQPGLFPATPGYENAMSRYMGDWICAWLVTFAEAGIGAVIFSLTARKAFAPLIGGALFAAVGTALSWLGQA